MLLNRDFFADKLDTIKDCKECIVPIQITSISEDAFLDWYNIQYIVLHPGIKVLPKSSFYSDNLKLIIGNMENVEDFKEVTILPYTDYYEIIIKMYDISATMEEIISFNDLSKENLEKRKANYNAWAQSLINELNKKQSNLSNEQDAYLKKLAKMEVDISKYYKNMQEVLEKIRKIKSLDQEYIKTLESQISTILNGRLVNVGQEIDYVNNLMTEQKQLARDEFDNYKRKLEEIKKELNNYFSKEIDGIEEKSTDLFNQMNDLVLDVFPRIRFGHGIFRTRDRRPFFREFRIQGDELLLVGRHVFLGENGFGRTFRDTDCAIDTLVGIDYQRVGTFVETIDRTYVHTVRIFAEYAGVGDNVGHKLSSWLFNS